VSQPETSPSIADSSQLQRLELREERAKVSKERVQSGTVTIRREVDIRTETFSVELTTETLVIMTAPQSAGSSANVTVNGQPLEAGQEVRIVIHRKAAQIVKSVVVTEDVIVRLEGRSETVSLPLELSREHLVIDKSADALVSEVVLEAASDSAKR
jgi:uncharacterized protein (TIGR02271 family)